MSGIMNQNQLTIVEEYEFENPSIQKIDSLIDNSIRDCHNKYFHTFDHICEYNLNFRNTSNNESVNFTISDKCMGMFELNKKLAIARGNGFKFNQINNFEIKIYTLSSQIRCISSTSSIFPKISHNRDYTQTFCNDRRNTFHFACRQWYSYKNPDILV